MFGPLLGVMFLMRALQQVPATGVQMVLALMPVLVIPLAWLFDGTLPSRRSGLCGLLALGLTALLIAVNG